MTLPLLCYDAKISVGKSILNLMLDAIIVVFTLIKLGEAMIYTFLVCVPIGASKLSFFKPLRTETT